MVALGVAMKDAEELKEMREHIRQSVNSLELCAMCQRICECEQLHVNESDIWICIECLLQRRNSRTLKTRPELT